MSAESESYKGRYGEIKIDQPSNRYRYNFNENTKLRVGDTSVATSKWHRFYERLSSKASQDERFSDAYELDTGGVGYFIFYFVHQPSSEDDRRRYDPGSDFMTEFLNFVEGVFEEWAEENEIHF